MSLKYNSTPSSRLLALSKIGTLFHEPTPRWYRAWVKPHADPTVDSPVLEGKEITLIWEDGGWLPYLAFPRPLVPFTKPHAGYIFQQSATRRPQLPGPATRQGNLATTFYDLVAAESGSIVAQHAAWTWDVVPDPPIADESLVKAIDAAELTELVGVSDAVFGTWYEEAELMTLTKPAHVKDPYHRVDAVLSNRHVQVYALDGTLLADSKQPTIVFETGLPNRYYLDRKDVIDADNVLSKDLTGLETICPYKGVASYHDVILPSGEKLENQVWTYLTPLAEAGKLKELVAFYVPGPKFKLVVDGEEVTV